MSSLTAHEELVKCGGQGPRRWVSILTGPFISLGPWASSLQTQVSSSAKMEKILLTVLSGFFVANKNALYVAQAERDLSRFIGGSQAPRASREMDSGIQSQE